ncbi:G/U mismatch-specific DNA glycosylase [Corynebacterium ulcerans]|nr:G/U mismatch-specific DNA glycosylase [Corynebacterium ulcerans]
MMYLPLRQPYESLSGTTDTMSTAHPSPLDGRRPKRSELADFKDKPVSDRFPPPGTELRLLIVGVNPGLWTAAVDAPFAYPGNRFWPSLDKAGIVSPAFDVSEGMSDAQEQTLYELGIAMTNLVPRATARADELEKDELIAGAHRVIELACELRPQAVAVAGITAFRTAFGMKKAVLGLQDTETIKGWPKDVSLWVVPQPSGLNAHETINSLAAQWRAVWDSTTPPHS